MNRRLVFPISEFQASALAVNGASFQDQLDCVPDGATSTGRGVTTTFLVFNRMAALQSLPAPPAQCDSRVEVQAFPGGGIQQLDLHVLIHHEEHRRDLIENPLQQFRTGRIKCFGHIECSHMDIYPLGGSLPGDEY
jgi:hypothetical protein